MVRVDVFCRVLALLFLFTGATSLAGSCPAQDSAPALEDPKPPTVRAPASERPTASPQPGLETRQAPRPLAIGAVTEDWPWFLGPRRDAISSEQPIEKDWAESGPRLVWRWKTGEGYASPSVRGDRLVFFHRVGDEEILECLDAETGQRFWRHAYRCEYEDDFGFSAGPKCSPLLEEDLGWTLGIQGVLTAFHLPSGTILWQRRLLEEFSIPKGFFGVGTHPLLWGNELIISLGVPEGPSVVGFDKRTGRLLWGAGKSFQSSYATPVPTRIGERDKIVVFGGGKLRPPRGGLMVIDRERHTVDVEFPWRSRTYYSVNASTPIVRGASVFLSESYGLGGIRLDLNESATEVKEAWRNERFDLHWHTPLMLGDHLYGFAGQGERSSELVCVEWISGKERWREAIAWEETIQGSSGPRPRDLGVYRGSLLHVDGATLCLGEWGDLLWLELSPKGVKVLARTKLFDADQSWSLPILSRGLLYICQNTPARLTREPPRLYCYDLRSAGEKR